MQKIKIIKKTDKYFPEKLLDLDDCPEMLYVLGNEKILNNFSIGVVGSRNCSEYGLEMTEDFTKELTRKNICIVSGLALGIDSKAHQACLDFNGKTIAVLGGGFDRLYPKENEKLFEDIIEKDGAVISEYSPDTFALPRNFVKRNRIVAGISDGILVVEAREKSGALITAKIAKKLNKKIFVVPRDLDIVKGKGSNSLISEDAKCVVCVKDILKEFPDIKFHNKKIKEEKTNIQEEYREIYKALSKGEKSIDELSRETKMTISQINYKLTMMEIDGIIKSLPNKRYRRERSLAPFRQKNIHDNL